MDFLSDFEMMLQRKKSMSGKRRRNRDGGTFISDADDVVSAMIVKMNEAAEVGHFRLHPSFSHIIGYIACFVFWPHLVACRIWGPQLGIGLMSLAVKAPRPSHLSTREFLPLKKKKKHLILA